MKCKECNQREISNKWHKLCVYCNQKRLDVSKQRESFFSRGSLGENKARNLVKKSKEKGSRRAAFKKEIQAQRPDVCEGCGKSGKLTFLTLSHTIPVSLRKDLEFESRNVHLECMDCHSIWENCSNEVRQSLLNYEEKIDWIKEIDPLLYHRKYVEL